MGIRTRRQRRQQRQFEEYLARKRIGDTDLPLLLVITVAFGSFVLAISGTSYVNLLLALMSAGGDSVAGYIASRAPELVGPERPHSDTWQLPGGLWLHFAEASLIILFLGVPYIIERRKGKADFLRITGRKWRRQFA